MIPNANCVRIYLFILHATHEKTRNPPNASLPLEENYNYSPHYWHVFAARLAFVVVFEVNVDCLY